MKKILIIRFSSIGDIVLTSPVIRCAKQQLADTQIHYLTKTSFRPVLQANPYIDKIYSVNHSPEEVMDALHKENYDFIVDLHRNLRSRIVKSRLKKPSASFPKLNFSKWLIVNTHWNRLPDIHIVERYFKAVKDLRVEYDGEGLDYFIPADTKDIFETIPHKFSAQGYLLAVMGGKHKTKQIPADKIISLCNRANHPVIIAGGKEDKAEADKIIPGLRVPSFNACGIFSLNQSAALLKNADVVLSPDTGLMHIAAAFRKPLVSVWGSTIPEFGMYPFYPDTLKNRYRIHEMKGLNCRPCSKLGFEECPKGHFHCMYKIPDREIVNSIQFFLRH